MALHRRPDGPSAGRFAQDARAERILCRASRMRMEAPQQGHPTPAGAFRRQRRQPQTTRRGIQGQGREGLAGCRRDDTSLVVPGRAVCGCQGELSRYGLCGRDEEVGISWAAGFAWCVVDASVDGVGRPVAGGWVEDLSGEEDGREDGGPASYDAECKGHEGR